MVENFLQEENIMMFPSYNGAFKYTYIDRHQCFNFPKSYIGPSRIEADPEIHRLMFWVTRELSDAVQLNMKACTIEGQTISREGNWEVASVGCTYNVCPYSA